MISGCTLVSGILFTLLITFGNYTLCTLLCYISLLQLTVAALFINGTAFLLNLRGQLPEHQNEKFDIEYVNSEQLTRWIPHCVATINQIINQAMAVIRCQNNIKTAKVTHNNVKSRL